MRFILWWILHVATETYTQSEWGLHIISHAKAAIQLVYWDGIAVFSLKNELTTRGSYLVVNPQELWAGYNTLWPQWDSHRQKSGVNHEVSSSHLPVCHEHPCPFRSMMYPLNMVMFVPEYRCIYVNLRDDCSWRSVHSLPRTHVPFLPIAIFQYGYSSHCHPDTFRQVLQHKGFIPLWIPQWQSRGLRRLRPRHC